MEKHFVAPENFENATIIFRNFSGAGSRFNKEGDRKFTYEFYDEDEANRLKDIGWYVKTKLPNEEGDQIRYRIDVSVSFRSFPNIPPAAIYIYSNGVKTRLDEDTVGMLDSAEIRNVDLTIRPRWWLDDRTNEWKVKAYLKEMHVTLEPSPWANKYADYNEE